MNLFSGKNGDANGKSTLRKRDIFHIKSEPDDSKDVIYKSLRQTLEHEKNRIVQQLEGQISDLTHHVLAELQNGNLHQRQSIDERNSQNSRKSAEGSGFHEKVFQVRDSRLTDLFTEIKHIRTIYHIFIAFLIHLIIYTALYDLVKLGTINLGLHLIYWNFQALPLAVLLWLEMQTTTCLVYFVFNVWGKKRTKFTTNLWALKIWDTGFLFLTVLYQMLFLIIPTSVILVQDLPIATSFAILMEQIRLVMKTYSFIRLNAPRVLIHKNHETKKSSGCVPPFSKYLYFLFAPTLIYRDEYPRTSHVRWNVVLYHFAEVVGVVFYVAFIMERYLMPSTKDFGKTEITLENLVVIFFGNNMPALLVFLCGFYCLLHSWLNAFAEMLRFGDRLFYKDWWTASSFAEYFKTWNVVVHDWLYAFIYKDGTELLTKQRTISTWLVFIISALFHEYILAFTFRFCYPVLFIAFGIISTCFVLIPRKGSKDGGNLLMWLSYCMGTGLCATLYMFEYYARINCPQTIESPIKDFFVPRSLTCYIS